MASRVEVVPVNGGELAVEMTEGGTAPVLAIHGISSTRRLWDWLRAEAPELTLIAPDLRGRGDSFDLAGPWGAREHSRDLVAVLDAFGLDRVHVCGMSMGGFIAIDLALQIPDRIAGLTLVDGGFPMASPPGLTREMLPILFADRLGRLDHEWASLDDYAQFFVSETAPLLDPTDPVLRGYLSHDLRDGKVRLSGDALLADAGDIFFDAPDWEKVDTPTRLLYAQWSKGADTLPAYSEQAVNDFAVTLPALVETRYLPGSDHAATIMTAAGAKATGELIEAALQ